MAEAREEAPSLPPEGRVQEGLLTFVTKFFLLLAPSSSSLSSVLLWNLPDCPVTSHRSVGCAYDGFSVLSLSLYLV